MLWEALRRSMNRNPPLVAKQKNPRPPSQVSALQAVGRQNAAAENSASTEHVEFANDSPANSERSGPKPHATPHPTTPAALANALKARIRDVQHHEISQFEAEMDCWFELWGARVQLNADSTFCGREVKNGETESLAWGI